MRTRRQRVRRKNGVPHRKRPKIENEAVHVTTRILEGLPSLRHPKCFEVILEALHAFKGRFDCAIVDFSVQRTHVHLIVEPRNGRELGRAMKGLFVRIAKALNKLWRRKGSVFAGRFHVSFARKMRQALRLVRYVLHNAHKHGERIDPNRPDPCSSGMWFTRWREHQGKPFSSAPSPVERAGTQILSCAKRFLLSLHARPYGTPGYVPPSAFDAPAAIST